MPTYRNSYRGQEVESATPLGYPWIEVDSATGELAGEHDELAVKTADAILADVGEDADLAQAALDAEQARETPRVVLSTKLQRIVDNAES